MLPQLIIINLGIFFTVVTDGGRKNLPESAKSIPQFSLQKTFFVEYFPEDGQRGPKHVGALLYDCVLLYLIFVQLLE
jgi:hypothetical protein